MVDSDKQIVLRRDSSVTRRSQADTSLAIPTSEENVVIPYKNNAGNPRVIIIDDGHPANPSEENGGNYSSIPPAGGIRRKGRGAYWGISVCALVFLLVAFLVGNIYYSIDTTTNKSEASTAHSDPITYKVLETFVVKKGTWADVNIPTGSYAIVEPQNGEIEHRMMFDNGKWQVIGTWYPGKQGPNLDFPTSHREWQVQGVSKDVEVKVWVQG